MDKNQNQFQTDPNPTPGITVPSSGSPRHIEAKVAAARRVTNDVYHLSLMGEEIAMAARPGQFVMVKVSQAVDPLLPRPFSIHRVTGGRFDILFRVVGQGTRILAKTAVGETLAVTGPLGRGFLLAPGRALLVAGGLGLAPLFFLAQDLISRGFCRPDEVTVLVGGRGRADILCREELAELGVRVQFTTEDGSLGRPGLVTSLVQEQLEAAYEPIRVFSCGPGAMLQAVAGLAAVAGRPCQVSLETGMACGLGVCLGCVVRKADTPGPAYLRVCREGPVFDAAEVFNS
ncbi:MAG: dihydroorotate dehydrogenase electron transfer subunit [Deltaproteobacteria bacterium]|nr:dihydroorotate dehydrogenase electron transfer subunit [Deltaproteobacteria bacterium]